MLTFKYFCSDTVMKAMWPLCLIFKETVVATWSYNLYFCVHYKVPQHSKAHLLSFSFRQVFNWCIFNENEKSWLYLYSDIQYISISITHAGGGGGICVDVTIFKGWFLDCRITNLVAFWHCYTGSLKDIGISVKYTSGKLPTFPSSQWK